MIRHFVALGDSFTEGIGDPVEGVELRSAHDWVAEWMKAIHPEMQYTNLAERGLRAAEIRSQQLQRALNLWPDFVSIIAGANDCLRGPFNADALKAELGLMFGAFEGTAQLFTATLPNFTLRLELPEGVRARLLRNLQTTNAIITELAERHGAIFYDFWGNDSEENLALWSEDRVHPNALGYLEIAKRVGPLLESHGIDLNIPAEVLP